MPASARCGPISGLAPRLLDQDMSTLSGGEAARCGLAALVLSRFDLYLLDEPTNDLDLDGLTRLERWILALDAGVVLVSHDRTFLANVITDVLELDEFTHRARLFAGGWTAYVHERETARRHAWEQFDDYDTKRKGLASRAQREREWATQGSAKAKKSDEQDKHIRAFKVNQTEQLAGRAARTERAIERLETVDKPREAWQLRLTVGSPGRSGDVVVRLTEAVVRRDSFQLGPIERGDRLRRARRHRRPERRREVDAHRRDPRSAGARFGGAVVRLGDRDR